MIITIKTKIIVKITNKNLIFNIVLPLILSDKYFSIFINAFFS